MAKPNLRVIKNELLESATREGHQMAIDCRFLERFDSVEARRNHYLKYGQVLLKIRSFFSSDKEFGVYVRENELDASTPAFRSDAMWMAENWSTLHPDVRDNCPYASPVRFRQWYGEQQGTRKPIKRNSTTSSPRVKNDVEDDEDDKDELPVKLVSSGDPVADSVNGLALAISEAEAYSRDLLNWLNDKPSRYEHFRDKLNKTLENWKNLATTMKELEKRKR